MDLFLSSRSSLFRRILFFCGLALGLVHAEPQVFLLASAGEAPTQSAHDLSESVNLPQAGIGLAYGLPFVTPYSETTLGYYNQRLFAEQYVGLQFGAPIAWARPSLTLGAGIQSAVHRKYTVSEGDAFRRERDLHFPWGLGLRLDVFDRLYAEWEGRYQGYPWWKFELGWRVL